MLLNYSVDGGDFARAGWASSQVKKVLKQLGIDQGVIKRVVVALYEAEVNIVAHAYRGAIVVDIEAERIVMTLKDEGPGIPDISLAMQRGYSTASPQVREMGFGAGMGLPNIEANSDVFDISTVIGIGTTLVISIDLKPQVD